MVRYTKDKFRNYIIMRLKQEQGRGLLEMNFSNDRKFTPDETVILMNEVENLVNEGRIRCEGPKRMLFLNDWPARAPR